MNRSQWNEWLRTWLAQHPVTRFPEPMRGREEFRDRIMQRIKARQPQAPVFVWRPRLRLGVALATVAAVGIVVVATRTLVPSPLRPTQPSSAQLVQQIEQDWQLLAQTEAITELEDMSTLLGSSLEEELDMVDELMMLAEDAPQADDAAWIQETYELLQEAGEVDGIEGLDDDLSDEELLQELEWLDSLSPEEASS